MPMGKGRMTKTPRKPSGGNGGRKKKTTAGTARRKRSTVRSNY